MSALLALLMFVLLATSRLVKHTQLACAGQDWGVLTKSRAELGLVPTMVCFCSFAAFS